MTRLKELRIDRHISQADFAREMGVAQNTVSNWENGNRKLDHTMIVRIADFFHVTTDYLLGRNGNFPESDPVSGEEKSFFRLKQGLEPYSIDEEDAEFLLDVFKAHKKRNG